MLRGIAFSTCNHIFLSVAARRARSSRPLVAPACRARSSRPQLLRTMHRVPEVLPMKTIATSVPKSPWALGCRECRRALGRQWPVACGAVACGARCGGPLVCYLFILSCGFPVLSFALGHGPTPPTPPSAIPAINFLAWKKPVWREGLALGRLLFLPTYYLPGDGVAIRYNFRLLD